MLFLLVMQVGLSPLFMQVSAQNREFPYAKMGLSKEQAMIHLLKRFTYGFEIDAWREMEKIGPEQWFIRQLQAKDADEELFQKLEGYGDIFLDNKTLTLLYPKSAQIRRMMVRDGYISKDSVDNKSLYFRRRYRQYLKDKGLKRDRELYSSFISSKLLRAVFSKNQLQEVMTDFWFNHFNVSFTKGQAALFIPSYESRVIRPNALGKFDELLLATAKSPAMLFYLDNASSVVENSKARRKSGINENYARELMELHTLGVDGGYTQKDVTEAARILTGWTVYPMNGYGNMKSVENLKNNKRNVVDGDFVFSYARHDKGIKSVLGQIYEGQGYEEGTALLDYLASRSETATFISKKLACRFVSDDPDEKLVKEMADVFLRTDGDIKQVLEAMVYSPLFWEPDNLNAKIKTPFELVVSSIRGLEADVEQPEKTINWVTKIGEKKYYYVAPTGFPDKSNYWVNTGALLSRMNFGLSFPNKRNSGVAVNLTKVLNYKEPEGARHALEMYADVLLPDMDKEMLRDRLEPLMIQQGLKEKVEQSVNSSAGNLTSNKKLKKVTPLEEKSNNATLAQIVGVLLGAPEFQRR